jgi:hypothetical protein
VNVRAGAAVRSFGGLSCHVHAKERRPILVIEWDVARESSSNSTTTDRVEIGSWVEGLADRGLGRDVRWRADGLPTLHV